MTSNNLCSYFNLRILQNRLDSSRLGFGCQMSCRRDLLGHGYRPEDTLLGFHKSLPRFHCSDSADCQMHHTHPEQGLGNHGPHTWEVQHDMRASHSPVESCGAPQDLVEFDRLNYSKGFLEMNRLGIPSSIMVYLPVNETHFTELHQLNTLAFLGNFLI